MIGLHFYKQTAPCSIFIVRDNVTMKIKLFSYIPITKYDEIGLDEAFSRLDDQYNQFKKEILAKYDYSNLPDYSFIRANIREFKDWEMADKNPLDYFQNHLPYKYGLHDTTFYSEYISEFSLKKFPQLEFPLTCHNKSQIFGILSCVLPYPHLTSQIIDELIKRDYSGRQPLSLLSDTEKNDWLDLIRSSKLYEKYISDENTSPLHLVSVENIHVLLSILKKEKDKADELELLYNVRNSMSKGLDLHKPYNFIRKEVDLLLEKYYECPPDKLIIPSFVSFEYRQFLDTIIIKIPNLDEASEQLSLFFELSEINQKLQQLKNNPEKRNELCYRQTAIIDTLLTYLPVRIRRDISETSIPEVVQDRYHWFERDVRYLSKGDLNPHLLAFLKKIQKKLHLTPLNYKIIMESPYEFSPMLTMQIQKIISKKADCFIHNLPEQNTDNITDQILHIFSLLPEKYVDCPSIFSAIFRVNTEFITSYPHILSDFCKNFLSDLHLDDNPYVVIATPQDVQTEIQIICSNLNKENLPINSALEFTTIERAFRYAQQDYHLYLNPLNPTPEQINKNLSQINLPESGAENSLKNTRKRR